MRDERDDRGRVKMAAMMTTSVPNKFLFYVSYDKVSDLYNLEDAAGYKMSFINEAEARSFQSYKNANVLDDMFDVACEGEQDMNNPFFANYQYALGDAKDAYNSCLVRF
jgi:hypothetical protein